MRRKTILILTVMIGSVAGGALALALTLGAAGALARPTTPPESWGGEPMQVSQQALCDCNVIVVAKSNGDFTSVVAAMNSITNATSSNRYLVWVGAGTYTESDLVQVKEYVHLQGAGPNVTIIESSRSAGTPGPNAATAQLDNNGRISDLALVNKGTGTFEIALYSTGATRSAVVDNVVAEANGSGGTGHYAVYLNDAEPTLRDSVLRASGATGFGTGVNAAVGIVNISGGFPRPLIEGSLLTGGDNSPNSLNGLSCAGNTGTGFGIQGTNAAPLVRNSYVCGDRRGVFIGVNGQAHFHHSEIWASSTGGSFLLESTGSGTILITHSGVFYVGNKYTGTGGLVCTYNHLANYVPASDGQNSATACN